MKFGLREIVFLSLMLALLGGSWWFGFRKVEARREVLLAETAQKQRELTELRQATADVDDLGRRIDDLQAAIEFFESKLPREKEVEKVLRDVWSAAENHGLEIKRFETLPPTRSSHYSEQPIRLELGGDFEGFYAYLLELEALKRITRVTKMNLKKVQDRSGAMEAEMVLSIFFEPGAVAAGSVAAAQ